MRAVPIPVVAGAEQVLTKDALEFVELLQRELDPTRQQLLGRRQERQSALDAGERPDFLAETRAVREASGASPRRRADLRDRRCRDHRPGRAEDDDQRAQLGRARLHGRLRGLALADLGERRRGPAERARRGAADDLARHGGEELPAERRDRDARDPPARLAPGRAPRARRRRAGLGEPLRLRARRSSTTRASCSSAAAARTSTCRSSRATSRRGSGTRRSRSPRTTLGLPRGSIRCTVLIETILAAFEMEEILYELRELRLRAERGPLGLHLQRDQEARRAALCPTGRR